MEADLLDALRLDEAAHFGRHGEVLRGDVAELALVQGEKTCQRVDSAAMLQISHHCDLQHTGTTSPPTRT